MKTMKILCATLAIYAQEIPSYAQEFRSFGAGPHACQEITNALTIGSETMTILDAKRALDNWSAGFLSAVAVFTGNPDPLNGKEPPAFSDALASYCRTHPDSILMDVAMSLIQAPRAPEPPPQAYYPPGGYTYGPPPPRGPRYVPDWRGGMVPFTNSRVMPDGSLRSYDPRIDGY